MKPPSVGFSDFFLKHSVREAGNSYTTLPPLSLLNAVQAHWHQRVPGTGEGDRRDRKVLVPLPPAAVEGRPAFYCPARVPLVAGMPLCAEAVQRQPGEDPFVEVFITPEDAVRYGFVETPATTVNVVCYSAAALLENGGSRTGNCDWEIVTLLCSTDGPEHMPPLTMARNMLEKAGGSKPAVPYSSEEWANAVWASHQRGVKVRPRR